MNLKNCVYISWKIKILTKLQHKITQIYTKRYHLPSKFSKLQNLEANFCELLRLRAPPFQKIFQNPWNLVTTLQKSCFLGPTIFEIPQPNYQLLCTSLVLNVCEGRLTLECQICTRKLNKWNGNYISSHLCPIVTILV